MTVMHSLPKQVNKLVRFLGNKKAVKPKGKRKIFVIGFSTWKTYLRKYFDEYELFFLPKDVSEKQFKAEYRREILKYRKSCQVFIWGFKAPNFIFDFLKDEKIATKFVEDGFVRSIKLGATKAPPMSLCLDSVSPYFDATKPTDLEMLLNSFDFTEDSSLLKRAEVGIKLICDTGVSKYNNSCPVDINKLYGKKVGRRVLVLGQVEDDASIKFGCETNLTNNDVVRLAAEENPDAQIIYKPHPDVLNGHRIFQSNPQEVADICLVLTKDIPLANALETIDHAYTITSLAGFEALMRGVKVTTLGCPFYSGWGLTDDRQANERRQRKLTLEQLFSISYLLYPKYFDIYSGAELAFEDIVNSIYDEKNTNSILTNVSIDKVVGVEVAVEVGNAVEDDKAVDIDKSVEVGKTVEVDRVVEGEIAVNIKEKEGSKDLLDSVDTIIIQDSSLFNVIESYFSDFKFLKLPSNITAQIYKNEYKKIVESVSGKAAFFSWGFKYRGYVKRHMDSLGIETIYLEDGFLRSVSLGRSGDKPVSLTLDLRTLYFDSNMESDLERMLLKTKFDDDIISRSKLGIKKLLGNGLSKYNNSSVTNIVDIYGPKDRKRILVIGQVEDDASIKFGMAQKMSNNDLVRLAHKENPNAQIIYKPHPDVLAGHRAKRSNPEYVSDIALILVENVSLASAFETIDHVYTLTSLAGFEALLRKIKVTVLGCPFYAGWGLTDDRQFNPRRNRTLTIEEVFAAAYLLYPRYFDPESCSPISFEDAVKYLEERLTYKKIGELKAHGDYEECIALLDSALNPRNIEHLAYKADFLIEIKEFEKAYETLKNLSYLKPKADVFYKITHVLRRLGRFSVEIEKNFEKCICISKGSLNYIYHYINYLWEKDSVSIKLLNKLEYYLSNVNLEKRKSIQYGKIKLLQAAFYADSGNLSKAKAAMISAKKTGAKYNNFMFLRYYLYKNGYSDYLDKDSYDTFCRIRKSQTKLKELILMSGGSVCIVGNSPSLLGKKLGGEIDNTKLVIRFNNYSTDYPYSEDYGVKTDVWVRLPFDSYVKKDFQKEHSLTVFTGCNRYSRPYSEWEAIFNLVNEGYPIAFFDASLFYEAQTILSAPPSAGILMAYQLYKLIGPLCQNNYYGFSYLDDNWLAEMKTNYHYSDKQAFSSDRHDWIKEAEFFRTLLCDNDHQKTPTRIQRVYENKITSSTDIATRSGPNLEHPVGSLISISPGLKDYEIFGSDISVVSSKNAENYIKYLDSGGVEGQCDKILARLGHSDILFGFGRGRTGEISRKLSERLDIKNYLVEYGFISSMYLPSEKRFNFSLVLDDVGIFYDTTRPSRIESILNGSDDILSAHSDIRANELMTKIVNNNITKYNNSADALLPKKKALRRILVIDQTANDNSILLGQCETYQFGDMLQYALDQPDSEVF
ncbi:glycosyltransferase family 29 protein, partial [Amphritea sp. 2_MG-2023]|uniref:glycosyltransferase family 29 protein n=1 Tax=Amphritea sp. 2_MG-2023 TaxID=3062682 RepID=UPI0026E1CABB